MAIPILQKAPQRELDRRELAASVAKKLGVTANAISGYFDRHSAFKSVERDGRKFVGLSSDQPAARAVRARRQKPTLAERMAELLLPFLESGPAGQRDLSEVARYLTPKLGVIPATVYAYLKRIPGVERIDEGDMKLVRIARGPDAAAHLVTSEAQVRNFISAGETPTVEFKSTLMFATQSGVKDPKLQKMVTKTIAAFANTRGGTLLIGVKPDGTVCGIELDCSVLPSKDDSCVDTFSRSLAAITAQHLGPAMAAQVVTEYVRVDNRTVCVVRVQRSHGPVYLKADEVDELYVRNGTTSIALPVREIAHYVKRRF